MEHVNSNVYSLVLVMFIILGILITIKICATMDYTEDQKKKEEEEEPGCLTIAINILFGLMVLIMFIFLYK